jgi:hypothetical protein
MSNTANNNPKLESIFYILYTSDFITLYIYTPFLSSILLLISVMADPGIKTFTFSKEAMMGGKFKKSRATRKNVQDGGSQDNNSLPHGVSPNIMKIGGIDNSSLAARAAPVISVPTTIVAQTYDVKPVASSIPVISSQVQQTGGSDSSSSSKTIKVELRKHHTQKKVHLNPKTSDAPKHIHKKDKTKKARKVTLGVKTLHKRMTRAKKLRDTIKKMTFDELKEELVKKKLIKPTSKAPESVLRQIAIDSNIVAKKAL